MKTPPLRVLVVDDDELDRQLICRALTDGIDNLVLVELSSGQELMAWLSQQPILESMQDGSYLTVILLDMHMPRQTGLETLQLMKQSQLLPYRPVVMLSGSLDMVVKQRAYELGIHLYLVKPTAYRGFYRVVEAIKLCYRDGLAIRNQSYTTRLAFNSLPCREIGEVNEYPSLSKIPEAKSLM
jgi:CheY-like chemotaxis protein